MPATTAELAVARSWIGTSETDAVFNERFERLGSLDSAITESMRAQLAALIFDQPAQFSAEGISMGTDTNIRALQAELDKFIVMGGTDGITDIPSKETNVTRLHRPSFR